MHIIIASSEPEFAFSLERFLREQGIAAEVASDGVACRQRLRTRRPDALALDSQLNWGGSEGDLDGLLEITAKQQVPVLLLLKDEVDAALKQHASVVATASAPYSIGDLARQVFFVAELAQMKAERP